MSLPVSIDTMKSTINRRGGLARGNRFGVYISHPSRGMNSLLNFNPATLLSNLISGDGVHIGDFIQDPRDMFLLCQSCTIVSILTGNDIIDMWQEMIIDTSSHHYKAFYKNEYCSDVTIQQLSNSNDIIPGYTIKLENAYPIQVGAVELSNTNEGLMEVSITWEYDNFRSVGLIDGFENVVGHMLGIGRDTLSTFKRLF